MGANMAEAAIAAQSQAVTGGARVERSATSSIGGVNTLARAVSDVAGIQRNFYIPKPTTAAPTEKPVDKKNGNTLLSTSSLLLLAETRTQEAGANFVAPDRIGLAHANYASVQANVRETILNNQSLTVSDDNTAATKGEIQGESDLKV
ncbi:hypothetical protein [Kordiimonas pumila]|uniref:Uncharacterized protein n=1 Tax=Kordiimonas pumila TaxID=2161677 RepID=A0ABV7D6D5_9PROT|nr:hypothetical protein [Kordiimonas pumila]